MNIQWFPGHMKKSFRSLEEWIKNIDMVLVVLDARAPYSCINNTLEKMCAGKEICYCFNKIDLANPTITDEWIKYFESQGKLAVKIDATKRSAKQVVEQVINKGIERKKARKTRISLVQKFRVAIVGVPNTGKSTLLNTLAGSYAVKTGNIAGVTRSNTWIKIKNNIELMDNAGTLEPKFADEITAENIAFLGSINTAIIDEMELATTLIARLKDVAPTAIQARFKLESMSDDGVAVLEAIAKSKGLVKKGGELDLLRASAMLINDFRSGKLGRITLETVESRAL